MGRQRRLLRPRLLRSRKRSVHFSETLQVTGGCHPNRAARETAVGVPSEKRFLPEAPRGGKRDCRGGCLLRNAFFLKPPGALVTHNGSAIPSPCAPSAYPKQCMGDAYTKSHLLLI